MVVSCAQSRAKIPAFWRFHRIVAGAFPNAHPGVAWDNAPAILIRCRRRAARCGAGCQCGEHTGVIDHAADGDTVVLAGGETIRLVQIDTPEKWGDTECYGTQVSAVMARILPPGTSRGFSSQGGSACNPNYTPCIPNSTTDLDCGDIDHPVNVVGSDPYRLDSDGDGSGCET